MSNDPSAVPAPIGLAYMPISIAKPSPPHPDEVTLRFTRWTQHGGTAYQKGQAAGFLRSRVEHLIQSGRAVVVER